MFNMRLALYTFGSVAACTAVIANALIEKEQFFPASLSILNSAVKMAPMYNLLVVLVVQLAILLRKLFLGPLRAAEQEYVYERGWFAVTETCLAMSLLREELSYALVAQLGVLTFIKLFHWLAQARLEWVEQTPQLGRGLQARLLTLLTILYAADCFMVVTAVDSVLNEGPSYQLLLGSEYVILSATVLRCFIKYIVHAADRASAEPLPDKALYLSYVDLAMDTVRSSLYMAYFTVMLQFYGLPMHLLREMWSATRAVVRRGADLMRFRAATANMNERYPEATEAELAAADRTCIICREDMNRGKKLPCGHVFHLHCLRAWLQRQQTCPTCRRDVFVTAPTPADQAAGAATPAQGAGTTPMRPTAAGYHQHPEAPAPQAATSLPTRFEPRAVPDYKLETMSAPQLRELVALEERRLQARLGALQAMYAHVDLVMRTQLACQQALAEYTPPPPDS